MGQIFVNISLNWYNDYMLSYANYSRKAQIIAFLLDIISFPAFFYQRKPELKKITKILAIRPDNFGDLLMNVDSLYTLKKKFPESQLHLVTPDWNKNITAKLPFIDKAFFVNLKWYCFNKEKHISLFKLIKIVRSLRREKYDLFIDFRGDFRIVFLFGFLSRAKVRRGFKNLGGRFFLNDQLIFNREIHFYVQNFKLIEKFTVERHHFQLSLNKKERDKAEEICGNFDLETKKFVILHPTVAHYWKVKKWKDKNFMEIGRHIMSEHHLKIVICSGPLEQETGNRIARSLPDAINLSGQLKLFEFAALLTRSLLVISNDSAPMHLAANLGVPLIAVFGPTNFRRSGPYPVGKHQIAIEGDPDLNRPLFGAKTVDDKYFPETDMVIKKIDRLIKSLIKK